MTRPTSLVLAACAAALTAAGCGGGGGGEKRLGKADFVAKANGICRSYDAKGKALGEPASAADIPAYVKRAAPLAGEQVRALRALEDRAPSSVESDYGKALKLLDQQVDLLTQLGAAAGDQAKSNRIGEQGSQLNEQANALARKIGLTDCGKS